MRHCYTFSLFTLLTNVCVRGCNCVFRCLHKPIYSYLNVSAYYSTDAHKWHQLMMMRMIIVLAHWRWQLTSTTNGPLLATRSNAFGRQCVTHTIWSYSRFMIGLLPTNFHCLHSIRSFNLGHLVLLRWPSFLILSRSLVNVCLIDHSILYSIRTRLT